MIMKEISQIKIIIIIIIVVLRADSLKGLPPDSPIASFDLYQHCVLALMALDYSGTGWSHSEIWCYKTKITDYWIRRSAK